MYHKGKHVGLFFFISIHSVGFFFFALSSVNHFVIVCCDSLLNKKKWRDSSLFFVLSFGSEQTIKDYLSF